MFWSSGKRRHWPPKSTGNTSTLATKVYRKHIHTSRYLIFIFNHPLHVKRGLIQSLHNGSSTICQEQDLDNEIRKLTRDLQLNGYSQGFIDSVVNSQGSCRPNKEQKSLGYEYIPYVKGASEEFRHIGNGYNIRMISKTKHIVSSVMKTSPKRIPQQRAQCVYSIPCECGRSYTSETGRPLAVRLHEHRQNLK
jgi:hypothetical protein